MFIQILNHVQQALSRRITQYFNAPNFEGIITAISEQIQVIENALVGMNTLRYLDNAVGQQLDNIGKIVGIARPPGMSDALYKNLILGQIKINTSQGQPEQLIQLFLLLTSADFVIFYEGANAEMLFESDYQVPDQATADNLILTLNQAKPAGTRIDGIVSFDPSDAFAYDGPLPGAGYDDGSQSVGGKYAQLWEYAGGGFAYDGSDPTGLGYGSLADPLCGGTYLT